MGEKINQDNSHLDIYIDRYELHYHDEVITYREGFQNAAAQQRYEKINASLQRDIFIKSWKSCQMLISRSFLKKIKFC